jgi:hypothetical protein
MLMTGLYAFQDLLITLLLKHKAGSGQPIQTYAIKDVLFVKTAEHFAGSV